MENEYVKTNLDLGSKLTIAIQRDGVDIKLTREEVTEIFRIMTTHEHMAIVNLLPRSRLVFTYSFSIVVLLIK